MEFLIFGPLKGGYIYIMTNSNNTVLYTGVTSNLFNRVYEHRNKLIEGFTKRYNCTKLIYWEFFGDIESAIHREKRIKKYTRQKKEDMINNFNPSMIDLFNQVQEMQ